MRAFSIVKYQIRKPIVGKDAAEKKSICVYIAKEWRTRSGRKKMIKYIEDMKNYDGLKEYENAIDRMMKRYALRKGSYEYSVWAEKLFAELKWESVTKDINTPFWKIFTAALVDYSRRNEFFRGKWRNGNVRPTYIFVDNSIYYRTEYDKQEDKIGCPLSKEKIGSKYHGELTIHRKYVEAVISEFKELVELAEITDSMANFAPCPDSPFNALKGLLPEVSDFLNLMVDKIQFCTDEGVALTYVDFKKDRYFASIEQIKEWHNWLKENRERYYLQDYYDIDGERLIGHALFSAQSLSYPIPQTTEEIHECADNILKIIHNRKRLMISNEKKLFC